MGARVVQVMLVAGLLLVQAAFIVALLASRRRHHSARVEVERRLMIERMVRELASALVDVPLEQVTPVIHGWLERFRLAFGVDRVRLSRIAEDGNSASIMLSASVDPGLELEPHAARRDQLPQLLRGLFDGRTVRVESVTRDLPPHSADRRLFEILGVQSCLVVPLPGKDRPVGALSLAMVHQERRWTDQEADELGLIAEVIANVLRRQEAESELAQRAREAAHMTRVTTLGELASSLAHELSQPLTAILSNANASQRFLSASPSNIGEVQEGLADIVSNAHRASEVIQHMRRFLKKGVLVHEALDLRRLVSDTVRLVSSEAILRQVPLETQLGPEPLIVSGDGVQLQQVMLNLLLNALEASTGVAEPRGIVVEAAAKADDVLVHVRDQGPGIPPDLLNQIFEPFVTTKEEGLGMGLSICRSILEGQGGSIRACNNPGRGATMSFSLPRARAVAQ